MPSGRLVKYVDDDPDFSCSSSSSEEEEQGNQTDLLKGKKPETMLDIIEILIDKGGISVDNMIGVSNIVKLITEAKTLQGNPLNEHTRNEMGSCINLIILIANLYLNHMEKHKKSNTK